MRAASFIYFAVLLATPLVRGQREAMYLKEPYGAGKPLVSPDGAYALFGEQSLVAERNILWIEDRRTHERRIVLHATIQTLTLGWSPDSAAFVANDRVVSDVENAYIFDAKTLDRLDLNGLMSAAVGAGNRRFLKEQNQHSYFHAARWLDATHVEAILYGHTEGIWKGGEFVPGSECFNLRFRIARDGKTQKLAQRVASVDSKECETIESAAVPRI